jgi:hypothetical protein
MRATPSPFRLVFAALALLPSAGAALADASPPAVTEEAARGACPPGEPLAPGGQCKVAGFGVVGTVDGRELVYGLYTDRAPDDYTLRTAVIVYERQPDARLRPLVSADDPGDVYGEPNLLTSAGRTVLHLPGCEDGTGNFNRERLFVWRDGAWIDIDVTAWLSELRVKLPGDYEALKGIYPDYAKLTAATPLWRKKTDGNCCPTGGRADIVLGWQGDRLVLKSVKVRLGAKYARQF